MKANAECGLRNAEWKNDKARGNWGTGDEDEDMTAQVAVAGRGGGSLRNMAVAFLHVCV